MTSRRRKSWLPASLDLQTLNLKFVELENRLSQLEGIGQNPDMHGGVLTHIGEGSESHHAVNKSQLDSHTHTQSQVTGLESALAGKLSNFTRGTRHKGILSGLDRMLLFDAAAQKYATADVKSVMEYLRKNIGVYFTREGGIAIPFVNNSGGVLPYGTLCDPDAALDDGVVTSATDTVMASAVSYATMDGRKIDIPDGERGWFVVYGTADVILEDATGSTRGGWVRSSSAGAGRVRADGAHPGVVAPWDQQVGTSTRTVAAGAPGEIVRTRVLLHKN